LDSPLRNRPSSEAKARRHDRAVNDRVDAPLPVSEAIGIIDGQSAITDRAGEIISAVTEIVIVSAEGLPAELAADAEAADIAPELKFFARRESVT
jgi:hypothetical protein